MIAVAGCGMAMAGQDPPYVVGFDDCYREWLDGNGGLKPALRRLELTHG